MTVRRLNSRPVERVWGLFDLPSWAPADGAGRTRIGEIWFEELDGSDHELLVKLLFTSERLSIQVHPNDAAARAIGHKRGKDEAWLVLDAEPGAVIGLGLRREVSKDELRAAALSGAIEELVDWRPVRAGEIYYSPAGTIHAIGAGLTIMEIQQNLDLTYRLYDYGRPRELHLDEGVAVADTGPWRPDFQPREIAPGRELLHAGGAFVLERWTGAARRAVQADGASVLIIPILDGGQLDDQPLKLGSVVRVEGSACLEEDRDVIAAYAGPTPRDELFV